MSCQRDGCEKEPWSDIVDYCSSACEQADLIKAAKKWVECNAR